jgi:hypothetical protein
MATSQITGIVSKLRVIQQLPRGYSSTYVEGSHPCDRPDTITFAFSLKIHLLWLFRMTLNQVSDALIPYPTDITITTREDLQVSHPHGKLALLLASLLNPSPGRTLDRVYTSLGRVLETHANRAAHGLGLGPHVVTQNIKSHFGKGEERVQHLKLLRNSIPGKLEKDCCRLMRYTLPCACPACCPRLL